MAHIIKIWERAEIPEFCYKVGETLADNPPDAKLAEILSHSSIVWTLREALYDETGAFRCWMIVYYIPAPD